MNGFTRFKRFKWFKRCKRCKRCTRCKGCKGFREWEPCAASDMMDGICRVAFIFLESSSSPADC